MNQAYLWRPRSVLLAAFLVAIAWLAPAAAQAPPPAEPQSQPQSAPAEAKPEPAKPATLPPPVVENVTRLTGAIESAEKTIQHMAELEEELGGLRVDVETILSESDDTAASLRPQLAAVRSQIEKLGPAPEEGASESPALAAERARLTALESELDTAIKSTVLTWERARQLIEKITVMRHSLFTRNIIERRPSPLLPGVWRDVLNKTPAVANHLKYLTDDWLYWANIKGQKILLLLGAALALFGVLQFIIARVTDRRKVRTEEPLPSFFERAKSAAWVAPLRALPAIAASVVVFVGMDAFDLLFPPYWARVAPAVLKSIVLFAAVTPLIFAVLAPGAPQWRLVMLAEKPARRVGWLLCAIAAAFAIDTALTEILRVFSVPLALSIVETFAASAVFCALMIGLLLTPFTPQAPKAAAEPASTDTASATPPYSRHAPAWLKLPLWLIVLGILGLALVGYVALARFLAQQLVMTGIVVVVSWLLYLAIRAVTRDPQHRRYQVGEMLEARFGLDEPRRNQLARLTEIALTFALVICALPFLMLQWGFSGADIRDWFKQLFFGLEIGQFRISLARILLGILLFIALLFTTRLLQRWLREKALHQTRLDPGITNSIDTVVGYAGTALAALIAISYAGLDITNLAIVAGALSVGIGFGLQSIVNNFVSGLILLIERPIKVGDRIVVGDQQGLVRRISVRATEIETFDRASLIVPNSELITGRVLNWTHRDSLGAVNVKVGVGYDSDPEQVIAILKKCADDHRDVLRTPAPAAFFENFGDSALMFNLRIALPDIASAGSVQSDLRVAILKAMRAANIEIPFNQLDVNLRELDGVRRYLTQHGEERAGKPVDEPAATAASNGKRVAGE